MSGGRIENLPPEEWTPEVEAILPILVPPGAPVKGSDFNSLLVIAHHPQLADPFLRFTAAASRGILLSAPVRELAILRVAWRRHCRYEWVHHVIGGAGAGLGPRHFAAVQEEGISDELSAEEQAVIAATDELCGPGSLSDAGWERLGAHFDHKQIIELILLVGCYLANASFLNSVRIPVEAQFLELVKANGWPLLP